MPGCAGCPGRYAPRGGMHSLPAPAASEGGLSPVASWFPSRFAHPQARPRGAPVWCTERWSYRQNTERPASATSPAPTCSVDLLGFPMGIRCTGQKCHVPCVTRAVVCFGVNSTLSSCSEGDDSCLGARGRLCCWGKSPLPSSPRCLPCLPQLPFLLPACTSLSQTQEHILKS